MDIQAKKIEIMKLVLETDNPDILESIKALFKRNTTADFWETIAQEQKDDILQGIKKIENGELIDYEDSMKKHR